MTLRIAIRNLDPVPRLTSIAVKTKINLNLNDVEIDEAHVELVT